MKVASHVRPPRKSLADKLKWYKAELANARRHRRYWFNAATGAREELAAAKQEHLDYVEASS